MVTYLQGNVAAAKKLCGSLFQEAQTEYRQDWTIDVLRLSDFDNVLAESVRFWK